MNLDILPPEVELTPDINLKIRAKILGQVLLELLKSCGATDCKDTIKKGIIERYIIEEITISFINKDKVIKGQVVFCIDWKKLEFLAKTNEGIVILNHLDLNKLISKQLDPVFCSELSNYVIKLKRKYNIKTINTTYKYRDLYRSTDEVHEKTRKYLGHVCSDILEKDTTDFNYELKAAFLGLDGYLNIYMRN